MLSAAICGRSARCDTRAVIGPAPPVDQLMSTGDRARVSSWIRANVSLLHVGAPSSYARLASSAISTGVYGMAGQCFLVVTAPVSAHERMTLSEELMAAPSRRRARLSTRASFHRPSPRAKLLDMHRFALLSV